MTDDLDATAPARRRADTVEATEVATRTRRPPTPATPPAAPPVGRTARAPESTERVYPARSGQPPVVAERMPAPRTTPQAPVDMARDEADRRRGSRTRIALVAVAASVVVIAASATLMVLLFLL